MFILVGKLRITKVKGRIMPEIISEQPSLFDLDEPTKQSRTEKKRANYLQPVSPAIILQVWQTYVDTFFQGKGRKPRLSDERTKLITVAVNQFGSDIVKDAIRGCALSPWHMGQNPSGTVYNSLELILRDSAHIERFSNLTVADDSKGGFLDD
jgi:hypothetical protein